MKQIYRRIDKLEVSDPFDYTIFNVRVDDDLNNTTQIVVLAMGHETCDVMCSEQDLYSMQCFIHY